MFSESGLDLAASLHAALAAASFSFTIRSDGLSPDLDTFYNCISVLLYTSIRNWALAVIEF